ncbi:MAG: SurA N-terminal domain-containing protein [Burkholderiaceae bacterium]
MFDFIRSHQRLMQLILLILIVPSFVFFGIQGYDRMHQNTQGVATVGGQTITQGELDNAQRDQLARMRQSYGPNVDTALFDTPESRAQTLNGLIAQQVLFQQAQKQSLGTSDRRLQETIMGIPALQENGRFSSDRYQALLAQQGMTPAVFETRLRQDLALQQLSTAIEESVIVPQKVIDRFAGLVAQRRDVSQTVLKVADFAPRVKLAPDAVQKEYDAHPGDYMTPETVKAEYIVLSADALARQVNVSEQDARGFYEQNRKRYEVPEERRASHILIAAAKDASDADKAKAKVKAEEVLAKVRANPSDFAKFAKQYSEDPGSATNGGDLDYLGRGATVPPFEAALFSLKDKEISGLVQSDFGYHIIELTGIKPAQAKAFESVRSEIETEIRKQLAQKKFTDAAEAFANGVYEQGDSLAPTAKKFDLKVMTAENVMRTPAAAADAANPLSNAKLLASLFSADSLKNRHNTEAIEISPGTLVSARVTDYKPAAKKPIAEVADAIKAKLVDEQAKKLVDEAGKAKLAQLRSGGNAKDASGAASFGAVKTVSRLERSDLAPEAVAEIFKADASHLPAYAGIAMPSGGYAIYQISGVSSASSQDPNRRTALAQSIAKQLGAIEFDGYLSDLRNRTKVKVNAPYAAMIEKANTAPAKSAGS